MEPETGAEGMTAWEVPEWLDGARNTGRLEELLRFMAGDWLGGGVGREVYDFAPVEGVVLKVARDAGGRRQNLLEYMFWEENRHNPIGRWLAPVHRVSAGGQYLLMDRVVTSLETPDKVPADLVGDCKPGNVGRLDGRWVFCDYGTVYYEVPGEPTLVDWETRRK